MQHSCASYCWCARRTTNLKLVEAHVLSLRCGQSTLLRRMAPFSALNGCCAIEQLMRKLSHPNIVRYIGTERDAKELIIFLELVPGGSISSMLGKYGKFKESVVRGYCR